MIKILQKELGLLYVVRDLSVIMRVPSRNIQSAKKVQKTISNLKNRLLIEVRIYCVLLLFYYYYKRIHF